MPQKLHVLFAQQATPDEALVALLAIVLLALVVAFVVYLLVLFALWLVRWRRRVRFGRLFFRRGLSYASFLASTFLQPQPVSC